MKRKFNRLICTVLSAAMLLSGCAENTDAAKGDPDEVETTTAVSTEETEKNTTTTTAETTDEVLGETTATVSETTAETTVPETTTTVTTTVTTAPSPDGSFKNFGEYKDENGEVLLEVTDGLPYIDYIAYYHGYFKVTNVSDKTVTDLREKIADIDMFSNTVEMMIEYPFGDGCVDIIKWENGKPDFENMKQYFDAMAQYEYTFDNTLKPEEYCIISVTFTNGAEITTATTGTPKETEVPIHKLFTGKWESTYVDDDGKEMLSLTDGIDYVDTVGYYHGYYKLTNVYGEPVTEIREKLECFYVFTETDWMFIEYPFNDNCVDFIEWTDGKPDLNNIKQSPHNEEEGEYTFDNTLDPEEYCIIYVVFTNGEEITTAAEVIPDQTSASPQTTTTTKAPETTTEKKTVTTTAPIEEEIPDNTTEKPLTDPSYSKYMPSDKIIKEAAEIAAKDKTVIVAIYENDKYEVMTQEEMDIIETVMVVESLISEESYNDMLEMYEEYPAMMEDGSADFLADYQSFVQFWLESFPDCKDYFDENGKPLVNTAPYFAVSFNFDGEDGNVKLKEVAETTIRWAFAQRTDDKNFNYLVDEAHKSLLGDSVYVNCTYKGGNTAHAEFIYYSHSIMFDPEATLTF